VTVQTACRGLRICGALLIGTIVVTATPALAQPQGVQWPEWQPTFRTKRTLVTVDCVVTDRNGRHVTDLTADDFEITVDRKRQPVRQAAFVPLGTDSFVHTATPPRAEGVPPSGATQASRASSPIRADLGATRRVLALVVDDLGLSFESTVDVRNALKRFVERQVQPGDLVAILRTAGGIGALQQFTADRRLMHAAADRVQWTIMSRSGVSAFTPIAPAGLTGASTASGSGTASVDNEDSSEGLRTTMLAAASLDALEYVVRGVEHLPGRKAVVFFSEGFRLLNRPKGFGTGGNERVWNAFTRLMDRANRAGVVVYTVDARGLKASIGASSGSGVPDAPGGGGLLSAEDNPQARPSPYVGGPPGATGTPSSVAFQAELSATAAERRDFFLDSQQALTYVAQQTGGFAILNTNDLNLGIERVLNDLGGYYLLGYDEPQEAARRTWEPGRIAVRVTRPGLTVRSRGGLFGPGLGDRPRGPEHSDPVVAAALSPFGASDIPVRLTALFGFDAGRRAAYARALLFIDANGVAFARGDDGRHEAKLDVLQIAVGDNGALLADWRRTITLSLSDEQLLDAKTRGVVYSTRMPVKKPGAYQVRVAIRDMSTDALGSASQFLEIPEIGKGRLAVSGVLVRAAGGHASPAETAATDLARDGDGDRLSSAVLGEPSVRIFEPGSEVVYAYEIYDGLRGDAAERLEMSTSLLRDGRVVYESPWTPVKAAPGADDLRVLPVAGQLSLGADVPPGTYTLQVNVAADRKRRAAQWADFQVRHAETPE
jgi:VWFA-related protein